MKNTLLSLVKGHNFEHCLITASISVDISQFKIDYDKLEEKNSGFFKLTKTSSENKTIYKLAILIPNEKDLKSKWTVFKSLSDSLEKNLVDEVEFSIRTVLSYSPKNYIVDPELPVILENQTNYGKLVLVGIRLRFPDIKEIDSVIVDLQRCPKCDAEHIYFQVFAKVTKKYNLELIKEALGIARKFASNFIKNKGIKNGIKKKK